MALTQRGIVYKVGNTESRQYKDKTFVSRELILEQPRFDNFTGEKLSSNYISFEATKEDTCKALDNFPQGSKVEVEFICRGSLFQKKDNSGEGVFVHLEIRNIAPMGATQNSQAAPAGAQPLPSAQPAPAAAPAEAPASDDYDSELGF